MQRVPQIETVTMFLRNHTDILVKTKKAPVYLTQFSKPVAVLVDAGAWDRAVAYIEDLEDALDALKVELAIAKGETGSHTLTPEEVEEWLAEGENVPA